MRKLAYYNDVDPYCCAVLEKHIKAGNLPPGDVDNADIRTVQPARLLKYRQVHLFAGIGGIPYGLRLAGVPDEVNIWTGGFPCQDISQAGPRSGLSGPRSGLWFEYLRLICALRPRLVLVENVSAFIDRGFATVLGGLAQARYHAEWSMLSACAVGAPHTRDRLFIVAHPYGIRMQARAHMQTKSQQIQQSKYVLCNQSTLPASYWDADQSPIPALADGPPAGVARLKGIGNAVVPQVVQVIGWRIRQMIGDC